MRRILTAALMTAACTMPLAAQTVSKDGGGSPNTGVAANGAMFNQFNGWITQIATEFSEADYAYKPTESVRTIGQLIGHVAGANYMFCAMVLGEPARAEDDIEKTRTTKAGLVEAIKASSTYCAKAYALNDAQAAAKVNVFGAQQTKMFALAMNAAHVGEHYGNLVTYMRMKGLVPPSSRQ